MTNNSFDLLCGCLFFFICGFMLGWALQEKIIPKFILSGNAQEIQIRDSKIEIQNINKWNNFGKK